MSKPVDEILEALPGIGLALGHMGQHRCRTWYVILGGDAPTDDFHAEGPTAAAALVNALRAAGVNVEDDGT